MLFSDKQKIGYTKNYKALLKESKISTINVKKMKILTTEIFKTINSLNPSFMKDIFVLNIIHKFDQQSYC